MKTLQWCLDRVGKEPVILFNENYWASDTHAVLIESAEHAQKVFEHQNIPPDDTYVLLDGEEAEQYAIKSSFFRNPHFILGEIKTLKWFIDRIGTEITMVSLCNHATPMTLRKTCEDVADAVKMFNSQIYRQAVCMMPEEADKLMTNFGANNGWLSENCFSHINKQDKHA